MTIATNTEKESSEGMPSMPIDSPTPKRTRPNPDKLPDNHVIDWFPQAKEHYKTELPPFVEKNQGSNKAGLRKKVTLLVTDDRQQGLPAEAEVICWSWDPDWTFYTIDIGGRRLIIKGIPDNGYCHYQSWLGPKKGFSLQYVAYGLHQKDAEDPKLNLRAQLANKIRKISNTTYSESSAKPDGRAQQTLTKAQYTPRPDWRPSGFSPINPPSSSSARPTYSDPDYLRRQHNTQGQQHHVRIESRPEAASPPVKDSPRAMETDSHDIQIIPAPVRRDSQHCAQAKKDRALSLGSRQDESSPKVRDVSPNSPCDPVRVTPSQKPSTEALDIKKDNPATSTVHEDKAVETRRAHHTPTEPANERSDSKQPHENIADAPPPAHRPRHQAHTPAEPHFPSKATKRKRQASSSNPTNPTSPQLSTSQSIRSSPQQQTTPSASSRNPSRLSTPTTTTTTSLTTNRPPSSSTTSSTATLLTPHKQSHTTLFIAIPLSTDTVPFKLRSCPSLPSFFASVLAISGLASDQKDAVVSGIRATFRWKGEGDVDRAILLKREVPDTWEVFLEIVDAAPCWGREGAGGRCGVGVEVVLV